VNASGDATTGPWTDPQTHLDTDPVNAEPAGGSAAGADRSEDQTEDHAEDRTEDEAEDEAEDEDPSGTPDTGRDGS